MNGNEQSQEALGSAPPTNPLKRKNHDDEEKNSPKKANDTVYYDCNKNIKMDYFVLIYLTLEDQKKRINDLVLYEALRKMDLLKGIINIKRIGFRRSKVRFNNPEDANNLVNKSTQLSNWNMKAFIPVSFVSKNGIIRDIPRHFTEEEILNGLISDIPVKSVMRFSKKDPENKDKRINTETVKLVFAGNEIPESIILFFCERKVEYFIPRTRQCTNCGRLGHLQNICKAKTTRCLRCGNGKVCDPVCGENLKKCILCGKSDHTCFDRADLCGKKQEQNKMARIMAIGNLTYNEAKILLPTNQNRFEILSEKDFDIQFPKLTNKRLPKNNTEEVNRTIRKDKTYKQVVIPPAVNHITAEPLQYGNQSAFSIPFEAVTEAERFINNFLKTVMTTAQVSQNQELINQIQLANSTCKKISILHDEVLITKNNSQSKNGKNPTV